MFAVIQTTNNEDPTVVQDLQTRLRDAQIASYIIPQQESVPNLPLRGQPYLHFRNPYIRLGDPRGILDLHNKHTNTEYLIVDGETVSVSPGGNGHLQLPQQEVSYFKPSFEPLPILLVTHRRPHYLRLALNSLFYHLRDEPTARVCILASDSDEITTDILKQYKGMAEIVCTTTNLGYAVGNFGLKAFKLESFVHFEDDFILPSNMSYHLPFWLRQLNHRNTTADVVTLRTSLENAPAEILQNYPCQPKFAPKTINGLWQYHKLERGDRPPLGGNGLVVNSRKLYAKPCTPPTYCRTDMDYIQSSSTLCLANIPVYHLGANRQMDAGTETYRRAQTPNPPRIVKGHFLAGGEVTIDLAAPIEGYL